MSVAKKLASQTAVYGVSSIVGRVLTYLLVPIYTGAFAAAEYGVVTGLYAYVSFLNVVFTYGMETTFFRFASVQLPGILLGPLLPKHQLDIVAVAQ